MTRSPRLIAALAAIVVAVVCAGYWLLQSPPRTSAERSEESSSPHAQYQCLEKDWTQAKLGDPDWRACAGLKIGPYEERLKYINALSTVDWARVKSGDTRLVDCAGWLPCEDRAKQLGFPFPSSVQGPSGPPRSARSRSAQTDCSQQNASGSASCVEIEATAPRVPTDCRAQSWTGAACSEVERCWAPEDPRLSTCEGLSQATCAKIQKCFELHPVDVGPGVRN